VSLALPQQLEGQNFFSTKINEKTCKQLHNNMLVFIICGEEQKAG